MASIAILVLALSIFWLGLKGFSQAGFPISRAKSLQGRSAWCAGAACLALALPLLAYGGVGVYGLVVAASAHMEEQRHLREVEAKKAREAARENRHINLFNRGQRAFYHDRNFRAAAAAYSEALDVCPSADAYLMRIRSWQKLGEFSRVEEDVAAALAVPINDAEYSAVLYAHRGYARYCRAEYAKAVEDFTLAIECAPTDMDHLMAHGFRGWICATCADPQFRDLERANADAGYLLPKTGSTNWFTFDQTAAMLAANNNFEVAVRAQEYAIEALPKDESLSDSERESLVVDLRARLQLYQQRKPYYEDKPRQFLVEKVYVTWRP